MNGYRILRDPNATEGGSAADATTEATTATATTTTGAASSGDQGQSGAAGTAGSSATAAAVTSTTNEGVSSEATIVTVPIDRFNKLLDLENKDKQRQADERRAEEQRRIKAGEAQKVISDKDAEIAREKERANEAESRAKSTVRDRELATALAGKNLLPQAPKQLMKLWADDFEAIPFGDTYKVVLKGTTTDAATEIERRLALADYANFRLPSTTGGAGATGTNVSGHTTTAADAEPTNLGEWLMQQTVKFQNDPAYQLMQPRGLAPVPASRS